ncbi:MAG: 30S ribosomal protein S6 [candidate division Zixibacteria bacterium]|nr:30S ribosomal protein S6 [candidate division Zixibacteria bacterium]
MKKYETTFVLDAGVDQSVLEKELSIVEGIIADGGGEVLDIERWGVRRFAYELKKRHQGNYIHVKFESPGDIPDKLAKTFRINEKILRYLTVLSPPADTTPIITKQEKVGAEDIPIPVESSEEKSEFETAPVSEEMVEKTPDDETVDTEEKEDNQ